MYEALKKNPYQNIKRRNFTAKNLNLYPVNNTQIELYPSKMFFLLPDNWHQPRQSKIVVLIRMEFWIKGKFLF